MKWYNSIVQVLTLTIGILLIFVTWGVLTESEYDDTIACKDYIEASTAATVALGLSLILVSLTPVIEQNRHHYHPVSHDDEEDNDDCDGISLSFISILAVMSAMCYLMMSSAVLTLGNIQSYMGPCTPIGGPAELVVYISGSFGGWLMILISIGIVLYAVYTGIKSIC